MSVQPPTAAADRIARSRGEWGWRGEGNRRGRWLVSRGSGLGHGESHLAVLRGRGGPRECMWVRAATDSGAGTRICAEQRRVGCGEAREIGGVGGWYQGSGLGMGIVSGVQGTGGPRECMGPCSHRQRLLALASARAEASGVERQGNRRGRWLVSRGSGLGHGESHLAVLRTWWPRECMSVQPPQPLRTCIWAHRHGEGARGDGLLALPAVGSAAEE